MVFKVLFARRLLARQSLSGDLEKFTGRCGVFPPSSSMAGRIVDRSNPIVFLEISIDGVQAGRVIIELRKDVVPRTAENFRALCTGEKGIGKLGKPLHYKGTKFFRALTLFMVQGGDIVNNNGSSGECIYGRKFEDENFCLLHDEGAISMANEGTDNTNSSQFFICTVPCNHLDGRNVVFGHVLSGLGLMMEIDKYAQNEKNVPEVECMISDCGEILPGQDWCIGDCDGTPDTLPPFPEDWVFDASDFRLYDIKDKIQLMRFSGNTHFSNGNYKMASRKYQKALRYAEWLNDMVKKCDDGDKECLLREIERMKSGLSLNLAAVKLKLSDFLDTIFLCNEVLRDDPDNVKALFRRGLANMSLNDYSKGLEDLIRAQSLNPCDKSINEEISKAKKISTRYKEKESMMFKKMFT